MSVLDDRETRSKLLVANDRSSINLTKNIGSIDNNQHRSIPKPSHQGSIELTTIDQTQANRSIIPTGYKDTPQHRSIEHSTSD
jgi:hypothetical protein